MMKKISVVLTIFLLAHVFACGDGVTRRKKGEKDKQVEIEIPTDSKVVWIIPAGAGAMRVSLGIFEAIEKDVDKSLDSITHMMAGVSSGGLAAAGLTYGNPPRNTAASLKNELPTMLRTVFPRINALADKLHNDYGFTLSELEDLFMQFSNNATVRPDFSSPAAASSSFAAVITNAAVNIPKSGNTALKDKLKNLMNGSTIKPDIAAAVNNLVGINRAALLQGEVVRIIGANPTVNDNECEKIIVVASNNKKPVFFANTALAQFLPGDYADGDTMLDEGLIATAAIPGIIIAPTVNVYPQAGGNAVAIDNLLDGFFAVGGNDPSALFYEVFTKQFSGSNLLIIYVGNGAKTDEKFRADQGLVGKSMVQKDVAGKKITLAVIDTKIVDSKGGDLFNLSGFYANSDLFGYMDKAVKKAVEKESYKRVVRALKAMNQ